MPRGNRKLASDDTGVEDLSIVNPGDVDGSADSSAEPGGIVDGGGSSPVPGEGDKSLGFGWFRRPDGSKFRHFKPKPAKRGRGRPRGSGGGESQAPRRTSLAVSSVERLLHSIHFGIAIALSAPEMQLSPEEAKQYAEAVAAVARHYDVGASSKTLDWLNLCGTMGGIYGARAMIIASRPKAARAGASQANGLDRAAVEAGKGNVDLSSMQPRAAA